MFDSTVETSPSRGIVEVAASGCFGRVRASQRRRSGGPRRRESGMTLIGWILTLVIGGFVVLIGLKLFPVYLDSFKVSAALESVIKTPDIADMSKAKIQQAIAKRLDIDDVDRFLGKPFKEYGKIDKRGGSVTITFDYRFEEHVLGNVSVLIDFVKTVHN